MENGNLKEYRIENSKYDVKEIRHYTTLKSLLSILRLGYLRPHKSKGDRGFSNFMSESDMKAISFLDSRVDSEIDNILKQNDKKGTMSGHTDHLALHMDKISAMIEVNLDKCENPESVKLLGNFRNAADIFIEGWNESIEYFKKNLEYAGYMVGLRDAYKKGGMKGYEDYLSKIDDIQAVEWLSMNKPGSWVWNRNEKSDYEKYEKASKYNLNPLTEELADKLRECCYGYDVPGIYRILMKLGIDKYLIRNYWSDVAWMFPIGVTNALGHLCSVLTDNGKDAQVELKSSEKIYLDKDNSKIYVFTGLVEGAGQTELLQELKQYEDRYDIEYVNPGQDLVGGPSKPLKDSKLQAPGTMRCKESINDRNLFKAVFMAGGPGSGKSFVANNMFGFNRSNISFTGAMLVNTDILFEIGLKKAGLPLVVDMSDEAMYERQMEIRKRAIELTETRESYWINSMLPLIIDGTGKDFEKIKRQSDALRSYGYDTSMVFVNTTVETALKRNQMRPRSLDPNMVRKMWEMVQANIGKFQEYFGPSNFIIIDSNVNYEKGTKASEDFESFLYKTGRKLLTSPLRNRIGIANIRYLKKHHGKYLSDLAQEGPEDGDSESKGDSL